MDEHQRPTPDTQAGSPDIDRLVREALDVPCDPQALRRLEAYWATQKGAAARSVRVRTSRRLAVAAAICVAFGLWQLSRSPAPPADADRNLAHRSPQIEPLEPAPTPPASQREADRTPPAGRAPTPFERVAFASMSRRASQATPRDAAPVSERVAQALLAPTPPDRPALLSIGAAGEVSAALLERAIVDQTVVDRADRALEAYLALVTDPRSRTAALAALRPKRAPTDALFRMLDHRQKKTRRAAALCLGAVNGPETTRRLIAIVTQRSPDHTEAWLALVACRGDLAGQFCDLAAHHPRLLGHYNAAVLQADFAAQ
ncbi:hypothetical protein Pla175_25700 [Pirellulimonas nuda]|uniref:HEAT repeat protein n=1 Tax=Pirellulimonas nuda TaxID=2528009 RepID=A0A518DCJ2_9BACT|nr:hypothetical protein [Pirellulimonas nuda]QDU89183.1 hypothetical protein Pla175_25700 [Pirellulimonas nuda]